MAVPSQDQVMGQLRVIIPALGTIVSAFGVSGAAANQWVNILLGMVGPIAYFVVSIWSLVANSRESIMTSAAKPAAPGLPAPQIVLPPQEADLAQKLPGNVNTTADVGGPKMSLNLGIRLALEAEGFSQAEIIQIENALPVVTRLLAAYKAADPDIVAIIPVAQMVINKLKGT